MSKNTQISELINYISVDGSGNIVFTTVPAASSNTDKFLVSDAGTLKFRTAAQLLSDIGAQASGSYQATLSGTGFVKISGSTISYDNSTYLTTSSAGTTYVPYTGATSSLDVGTNDLSGRYLNANGSAGLGGVLHLRQDAAYLARGNGYSTIASSGTLFQFFAYTGATTYKDFALRYDGLTDNTTRVYTLPDATGTLALTSNLSSYLPLSGGTLTGALSGTSGTFSGILTTANGSGTSVNITTNGNNGTSASPLQTNVNFYGYNGNLNGQIRVDDISGSSQIGTMKFYTWNATQVLALTLGHTGAATFTNSITASGQIISNNATGINAVIWARGGADASGQGKGNFRTSDAGGTNFFDFGRDNLSTGNFVLTSGGGSPLLSITTAGAATFSGSIRGGGNIELVNGSGPYVLVGQGTGVNQYGTIDWDAINNRLRIATQPFAFGANGGQITLNTAGNVGVGTISPAQKFQINGPLALSNLAEDFTTNQEFAYPIIYAGNLSGLGNGELIIQPRTTATRSIRFVTRSSGAVSSTNPDTKMIIRWDGNVGIGTNTPSYKLDISGTTTTALRLVDSGDVGFQMVSGGSSNAFSIRTNGSTIVMSTANSRPLTIGVNSSGGDVLGGTTGLTITSGGAATFSSSLTASSFSTSGFLRVHGTTKTFAISKNFGERQTNVDYFRMSAGATSAYQVIVYSVSQNVGVGWNQSQIFQASTAPYWGGWIGTSGAVSTLGSGSGFISSAVIGNDGTITFRVTTGDNGTNTTGTILSYIQVTAFNIDDVSITAL